MLSRFSIHGTFKPDRIARQLIIYIILCSSVITLLGTGLQLFLDYRQDISGIRRYFDQIEQGYLRGIAQSVWVMDDTQVLLQLDAIVQGPDIVYAAIIMDGKPRWVQGQTGGKRTVVHVYPLRYVQHGREEIIGSLKVAASLDNVYRRLVRRVIVILATNGLKTFLVAAFVIILFQRLVTRHLDHMVEYLQRLQIHRPEPPLRLARKKNSHPDELDMMVSKINSMQERSYKTYTSLRQSEERLRLFFDATEEGIVGINQQGICVFVNKAFAKISGARHQEEIQGKDIRDVLRCGFAGMPDRDPLQDLVFRAIAEKRSFADHSCQLHRQDGASIFISLRSYPVFSGSRCTGAVVFLTDISEQVKLQQEASLLSAAVRYAPLFVVVADRKGLVEYVNPWFERIVGYESEAVVGRRLYFLAGDMENRDLYRQMRRQVLGGRFWHGFFQIRTRQGQTLQVEAVVAPIRSDNGSINRIVYLARNVTREMELQDQLNHAQKMEAIGRLSASVAHEFGNPLLGIRFAIKDVLRATRLDSEQRQLMEMALAECDRLKSLIRDLQQFNRPSSGVRKSVAIHKVLDKVLLFHGKYIKTSGVQVEKHYAPDLPEVFVVEDQMIQVFVNLVMNAMDAMADVGGILRVTTAWHGREMIEVSISDTGIGIDPRHDREIFEPFFSTKSEVEGIGLGLAVSYSIIKEHGGDISFTSQPGQGTTFTVTLPVPDRNRDNHDS
ncbi:PAS domain S-box protein [Desulfolithobacter sp.]